MKMEDKILNAISRFLHTTTEPFDDWFWDGKELQIVLNNKTIEKYSCADLKELITELI